ncbi:putative colanic acid biosynthesis acetyltransferase [Croceicoccus ponticola]|uniref:Putative colanic acid biosynthesis acetyltransferase n=1 Tax=Croceicoccus ponticola TaxID=2217664 RepID=A0A437GZ44_9SPHN|nr:DapH/DapD/GlmU-related protein [Croceicoccus ponticola]RVQ67595.1 putative colanic acid biosynthesis acetyltransferase [Croceicoccus ponticola]
MDVLDANRSKPLEGGASFSLGNRLFRVVWMAAWLVLCRFTPPPLHGWRRLVLRLFGADVAHGARVHASVRIWHPRNLSLGANTLIGPGAILYNQGHIRIGARAVVSQRAHVCASSHDVRSADFQLILRPITIGAGCWIAAEAFVGPGVTIGDGAVLAARGALFSDADPQTIYRGNPAEAVRSRQG